MEMAANQHTNGADLGLDCKPERCSSEEGVEMPSKGGRMEEGTLSPPSTVSCR